VAAKDKDQPGKPAIDFGQGSREQSHGAKRSSAQIYDIAVERLARDLGKRAH
jgi:hypothetical protein